MGLAASQGRYLCLTARMSDLVYEGQQISQQRLALADQTSEISKRYTEAMNNKVMQATTPEGETQQLTYDIITSQDPFSGLCMRLVDLNGNVVVPKPEDYLEVKTTDADGNEVVESFTSPTAFMNTYMTNLSGDEINEMAAWSMAQIKDYYDANYTPAAGMTVEVKNNINEDLKNADEHYLYDENCKDPEYLQMMLQNGEWLLEQASSSEEDGWEEITWQGSSVISEVYYTADDAAAEAEYEAAMTDLQKKDKLLELRLEQVQTQEKAVEKELESVKGIIKKNVEDSFGTFA